MGYQIYVLDEQDITISGGGVLDGVTQGDGSHLEGLTITLNTSGWYAVSVADGDGDFEDNDGNQTLDGAQAIDGTTYADGTRVEAEYGLLLTDGTQTWQVVAFNVDNSAPRFGTVEGLAFIGGAGGFPPVGVPLTVVSAQEGPDYLAEDYATPICFCSGTRIETEHGLRPVEEIAVGDLVMTQDDGLQPVRWIGARQFPALGNMAPVVFAPGAIGNERSLAVSPQHRICIDGWRAQLWCGEDAVLVPAKSFVNGGSVRQVSGGMVTYHHLMCDAHQIIYAEGVATESFHPGETAFRGLNTATREELLAMFPELRENLAAYGPSIYRDVRGSEAQVLLAA